MPRLRGRVASSDVRQVLLAARRRELPWPQGLRKPLDRWRQPIAGLPAVCGVPDLSVS